MKKCVLIFLILLSIATISACSKKNEVSLNSSGNQVSNSLTSVNNEQQKKDESKDTKQDDYNSYLGKWISSETEYEDLVFSKGGSTIEISQINNCYIKGTCSSVEKPPANRIAEIEFEGNLTGNKLNFKFDDDGFFNKGNGTLTLENNKILLELNTVVSDENRSGWCIGNGEITFIRPKILEARIKPYLSNTNKDSSTDIIDYNILNYVNLTRNEIEKKLGRDYKVVGAGAEGSYDGYYYKKLGATIIYDDNGEKVDSIFCDNNVEIGGARAGMSLSQIQEILGKVAIRETWWEVPENKAYELEYTINDCRVTFLSHSSDGSDSRLIIYRQNESNDKDN